MRKYFTDRTELYHHGVLGQKWGVRRYQNYDGTRVKSGVPVTRHESMLSKYGGTKLKDILGSYDSIENYSDLSKKYATNINPSHSKSNCGSCSSAVLLNMLGGNYQALSETPSHMRKSGGEGYDPIKLIECYKGAEWSDKISSYSGSRKTVSNMLEQELINSGEGSKGIFYCEAMRGNKPGHYFTYAVQDGKVHVLDGQPASAQDRGIDYHTDFYNEVGKNFDVTDGNYGVYWSRLDNHPVKKDRIGDLVKTK